MTYDKGSGINMNNNENNYKLNFVYFKYSIIIKDKLKIIFNLIFYKNKIELSFYF